MKFPKPMGIILIGAIITIIGGITTAIGTYNHNKSSSLKTDKIKATGEDTNIKSAYQLEKIGELQTDNINLSSQVTSLQSKSLEQLEQIQKLTIQNADLALQLSESTMLVSGNITGGDAYCEFEMNPLNDHEIEILAIPKGKFPQYDLDITVTDQEGYYSVIKALGKEDNQIFNSTELKLFEKFNYKFKVSTMVPNIVVVLGNINVPFKGPGRTFTIFYTGRNGLFYQQIIFIKLKSKWVKASRLAKQGTNEILSKKIDKDFPEEHLRWRNTYSTMK